MRRQLNRGCVWTSVPGKNTKLPKARPIVPRVTHTSRTCRGGPLDGERLALSSASPDVSTLPFVLRGVAGRYIGWEWMPA